MWRVPLFYTENSRKLQKNSVDLSLSIFSFLERTPLVWRLHWVGGFSTIRTPSCCWDPNPSSFRCSPGSEPGGTSGTTYVCNPARRYTCGAPSSLNTCHDVFTDNVPTGMQSRQRSTRTGWLSE